MNCYDEAIMIEVMKVHSVSVVNIGFPRKHTTPANTVITKTEMTAINTLL